MQSALSLPPKTQWPNPELSIDSNLPRISIRRSATLRTYSFWAVKGPALDAYNSVRNSIKDCLRDRDDLFEKSKEAGLPYSIECYMVGKRSKQARPCIAILCECPLFCRKAINGIRETIWWSRFIEYHPAFTMVSLPNSPGPVRMAGGSGGQYLIQGPSVYTTLSEGVSNTALPLFYLDEEIASDEGIFTYITSNVASQPHAVMGGSFPFDQKRYGLTVAHAWKHRALCPQSQPMPQAIARQSPTFSFIDDFGEASQVNSEAGSDDETARIHIGAGGELPDFPEVPTNNDGIGLGQTGRTLVRKLGRIRYSSSGEPGDELDWAVIEFDDSWLESQDYENFEIAINPDIFEEKEQGFYDIIPENNLFPGPSVLENSRPISIIGREETIVSGVIKAGSALLSLSESDQLSLAQFVVMEESLTFGDCGRWIFDTNGIWYGHIVAGCPGTGSAYIAPAWRIMADIEATTDLTMKVDRVIMDKNHYTIPPVTQKDQGIGTTQDRKGKHRSVRETQITRGVRRTSCFAHWNAISEGDASKLTSEKEVFFNRGRAVQVFSQINR